MAVEANELRDSLMPLSLATRTVHAALYPDSPVEQAGLSGIARVLAALIPLYAYDPRNGDMPRRLTAEELLNGFFGGASHELCFMDGRGVIPDIGVESVRVSEIAATLRGAGADAPSRSAAPRTSAPGLREREP